MLAKELGVLYTNYTGLFSREMYKQITKYYEKRNIKNQREGCRVG